MVELINALLNTLFVSIPEEFIWVSFILIFLGRYDLLDTVRWKRNIKWISIPILSVSISTNILKYILNIPKFIISVITLGLMIILIYYITKKTDKIKCKLIHLKVILFTCFSITIIALTELIYCPYVLFHLNISIDIINNNVFYNFLCSLPSRTIQMILLVILICVIQNNTKFKNLNIYFKDRINNIILICLTLLIIILILFLVNVFTNYINILDYNIMTQLFISVIVFVLPTIILGIVLFVHLYNTHKILDIEKKYSNMLEIYE